ncbi:glutamate-rich protein GrpB [Indibacter alkaliphilus LW1]|uniref:Glutamate-rich protein GrpB n=1 Tax=Indibacter alkaliphilus (strain CCUG 57479 / KCTC 22604 / LW1) TaxID=1189612 RepID=S2DPU1_INDAL|nr:GrpB family protein [Indibacter alkaliphilus]EOZ99215.1 glutamate-rich protein GrpB [Indibacter alkaliphilus LW1]
MLLKKYTSTWIKDFEMIKGEIENGLLGMDFTIEHVGSTSVPELDAKPIIDIDIVFFNRQDFEVIKYLLEKLGYYHNGNQGIENREVFKRYGQSTNNILDSIAHHLYVCPKDSKALERHILSRNYLRKNEWARIKYQEMKYEIALTANQDRKKYAELKEQNINVFIDSIVEKEKSSL